MTNCDLVIFKLPLVNCPEGHLALIKNGQIHYTAKKSYPCISSPKEFDEDFEIINSWTE